MTQTASYLIAMLDLSDLNAFMTDYGQPVFPTILKAGGAVLAATPTVNVLEGNYKATWTVVIKFPSLDAIEIWYRSDSYQPFIPVRQALANPEASILIAAPGFTGLPD